jgi:hypothetical protein
LVGKPERRKPTGKPGRRWVDNIKMDFGEINWGGEDWICLAQDRDKWRALVTAVMGSMKCWETIEWPHNWWPLE